MVTLFFLLSSFFFILDLSLSLSLSNLVLYSCQPVCRSSHSGDTRQQPKLLREQACMVHDYATVSKASYRRRYESTHRAMQLGKVWVGKVGDEAFGPFYCMPCRCTRQTPTATAWSQGNDEMAVCVQMTGMRRRIRPPSPESNDQAAVCDSAQCRAGHGWGVFDCMRARQLHALLMASGPTRVVAVGCAPTTHTLYRTLLLDAMAPTAWVRSSGLALCGAGLRSAARRRRVAVTYEGLPLPRCLLCG